MIPAPDDNSDVEAFEARLRSLTPREPLDTWMDISSTLVPSTFRQSRRGYFAAVAISACVGAVVGVACTLWATRGNTNDWRTADLPYTPPASELARNASVSDSDESAQHNTTDAPATAATSAAAPPTDLTRHFENPPASSIPPQRDVDLLAFWVDAELQQLAAGSLNVGTRLSVLPAARSHRVLSPAMQFALQDARPRVPASESEFKRTIPVELSDPPEPQRKWLNSILESPSEFF